MAALAHNPTTALQYTDHVRTKEDAEQELSGLGLQDGFLGGRVVHSVKSAEDRKKPWLVQAFFQDEPEYREGVLEGMRRVTVPDSMRKRLLMGNPKDPSQMSAGEINKALDRLSVLSSKLTDEFIAAGRGHERPSEYLQKDDALATRARDIFHKQSALRNEIERRYGPGAPSRLPLGKGFGPIKSAWNPRKPTIYEALVSKLGRVPTNAELKAEVDRIKREALVEVAGKGKLRHQRKNANPSITADRGVHFTLGILGSGASRKSEVQSVVFDRGQWTVGQAKDWLKDHGFKHGSVDEKENTLRFRQEDPGKYKGFRTISPGDERRMNPEAASESMYESFHGSPSTETLEYEQDLHYHGNLAALGELVELKVNLLDGNKAVLTFDGESGRESNPQKWILPYRRGKKNYEDVGYLPYILEHDVGFSGDKMYRPVKVEGNQITVASSDLYREKDFDRYSRRSAIDAIKRLAGKQNPSNNPFWPFSSFHKTTIYHVPTNEKYSRATSHGGYNVYKSVKAGDAYFLVPELDRGSKFDSLKDAKKFIDHWNKGKRNPKGKRTTGPFTESGKLLGKATSAASRPIEEFTGTVGKIGGYLDRKIGKALNPGSFDSTRLNRYINSLRNKAKKDYAIKYAHYLKSGENGPEPEHVNLGGMAAQAVRLNLYEMWRKGNPEIPSDSAVLLASNEKGTQLYLVGGDQSLSLSDLGISGPEADKEHIVIGDATHIVYRTRKDFDGHKDLEYQHTFSEDSKGPLPELVYDRINQRLSLVGGVYFIEKPLMATSSGIED